MVDQLFTRQLKASEEEGRALVRSVLDLLDQFGVEVGNGPVAPVVNQGSLRSWVGDVDLENPSSIIPVCEELLAQVLAANVHTTHPRYFGLFNPAPVIWGEIADMISARVNPQLATWSHAPAAVEVELRVLDYIGNLIGYEGAAGFFTSGGEEANRAGVQMALVRSYPAYSATGLRALEGQPTIYVSAQSHLAWIKIASTLGLGHENVRLVPVATDLKMSVTALEEVVAADRAKGLFPLFIGATAGTMAAGVIDPLPQLAHFACRENLHLHVDAAWAGAVVLSKTSCGLLAGIELADSVTIDAHKWLSQPMGTGMFFCRDQRAPALAYDVSASYMPPRIEGQTDLYRLSPMWSRRWLGLRLFLSLAVMGRVGFEAQIDRDIALGDHLRGLLEAAGWRVVNQTPLPVVCFVDGDPAHGAEWHVGVAQQVVESGAAWLSTVHLGSETALRACITNWQSKPTDLEALLDALEQARTRSRG